MKIHWCTPITYPSTSFLVISWALLSVTHTKPWEMQDNPCCVEESQITYCVLSTSKNDGDNILSPQNYRKKGTVIEFLSQANLWMQWCLGFEIQVHHWELSLQFYWHLSLLKITFCHTVEEDCGLLPIHSHPWEKTRLITLCLFL